jgi:hypothetical protein
MLLLVFVTHMLAIAVIIYSKGYWSEQTLFIGNIFTSVILLLLLWRGNSRLRPDYLETETNNNENKILLGAKVAANLWTFASHCFVERPIYTAMLRQYTIAIPSGALYIITFVQIVGQILMSKSHPIYHLQSEPASLAPSRYKSSAAAGNPFAAVGKLAKSIFL